MLPRMPPELPRLPVPKIAFEASRTAMVVAVRAADFTIASPSESLRRAGVFGIGDDGAGCASRRRGRFGGSAGDAGASLPHGPDVGVVPAPGASSYWPRRRWPPRDAAPAP